MCGDYFTVFLHSLTSLNIHCSFIFSLSSSLQMSMALSSNGMKRLKPSRRSLFILGQHMCSPQSWLMSYFASSDNVYAILNPHPQYLSSIPWGMFLLVTSPFLHINHSGYRGMAIMNQQVQPALECIGFIYSQQDRDLLYNCRGNNACAVIYAHELDWKAWYDVSWM